MTEHDDEEVLNRISDRIGRGRLQPDTPADFEEAARRVRWKQSLSGIPTRRRGKPHKTNRSNAIIRRADMVIAATTLETRRKLRQLVVAENNLVASPWRQPCNRIGFCARQCRGRTRRSSR